uniref:Cas12f1-like TNB domain-containing protein n=1 Tax=Ignisphaera aggregans TaxID=334771 RepID=A0A7C5UTL3_9CREN
MINHIKDDQLWHRILQASFKDVQKAVEEKVKKHGVLIVYVNPKNTSKICLAHNSKIIYENDNRICICS